MKKTTAALAAMLTGAVFTAPQAHAQGLLQALGHATGLDQVGNQLGINGQPQPVLQPTSAQRVAAALEARGVPQDSIQFALDMLARSLMSGQGGQTTINGVVSAWRVGPVQGSCRSGGVAFKRITSRVAEFDVIGEGGWCWQSGGWAAQPGQVGGEMLAAAVPAPRPTPAPRQMVQAPERAPAAPARIITVREMAPENRSVDIRSTLYAEPSNISQPVAHLAAGQPLRVTGDVPGTPWLRAEAGGHVDFLMQAFLAPARTPTAPARQQTEQAQAHPATPSPNPPRQEAERPEPTPIPTPAPVQAPAAVALQPPAVPPTTPPTAPVPAAPVPQAQPVSQPAEAAPTPPPPASVQQAQTPPQAAPTPAQAPAAATTPAAPPPKKLKVDL